MSITQSYVPPIYEDLQAEYETEEMPESHLLLVHIPDGFTRQHIGAKVEHDFGRVRVYGERSLGNNRRSRFNALYQVPEYCDISRVRGKVDGKIVNITIPKILEKVPKQEPQPAEQEPKTPAQETEPSPDNGKEGTPPQSATTNDDQEKTAADDQVPKSTVESKDEVGHEISTPPKATEESMHQNGQEGIPQKATVTKVESEKQAGQETSTPPEATKESKPQNGQEGIPPKATITKVESEEQAGHEASTPPEDTEESVPQKVQEGISQKATVTTDAKLQAEEKFARETEENEEKQRVMRKEETEDHPKKTLESGKAPEKAVVDDSSTTEKESKEEREGSATVETFSTKYIKKENGKEINGKIGSDDVEKMRDKKDESTRRTTIKEVAASASEAMTNLSRRFNEEDKQRLIYMGAAVLVAALGVYATYKLRASRRP